MALRFLEKFRPWSRVAADWLTDLALKGWSRLRQEAVATVDLGRFRHARTFSERLQAISWPRAGVVSGLALACLGLGIWAIVHPRPLGVAGPLPTEREIELRIAAMDSPKAQPPASLIRGAPKLAVNPPTVPANREGNP